MTTGSFFALLLTVSPGHALAQQNPASQAQQPGQEIEEVVVTARRTEEKGQSVPVAVTALSAAALEKASIFGASDLRSNIPSLGVEQDIVGGTTQPIFTIRGLGQELYTEPTVVTYFADAPADTRLVGNSLFDLSSVQVLRGPQGTLFGKNAVGGAVLLEPSKPTNKFDGWVQGRVGNYGTTEFTGVLNLPLNEKVDARFAGNYVRADGWLKNTEGSDFNNKNHGTMRAELTVRPTDWLENETILQYFYLKERILGGQIVSYVPCPTFRPNCFYTPPTSTATGEPSIAAALALQQSLGPRAVAVKNPTGAENSDRRLTNISTVDLNENITLKNIVTYSVGHTFVNQNLTGTDVPVSSQSNADKVPSLSEEFQIQGRSFDDQLKWIAGVFYSDVTDQLNSINSSFISPLNAASPGLAISNTASTSTALFAQGTYDLSKIVEGLEFTGGYRYTWDDRTQSLQSTLPKGVCALQYPAGTAQAGQFYPFTDASCTRHTSSAFKADGYTYGLNYHLTDKIMVYVSRNKAYKAGGFNSSVVQPALVAYNPEYIVDTELGLKSDWRIFDRPLRINVSLYQSDFTNVQLSDINTDPVSGRVQSFVFNGANATIQGGELEFTYLPVSGIQLDGSWSYNEGTYGKFTSLATGSPVTYTGRAFTRVPKNSLRGAITYSPQLPANWGDVSISADYYYQSSVAGYPTRPQTALNTTPGYGIANLRIDVRNLAGGPIDLGLYMKNVFDKTYEVFALDDSPILGFASNAYGEPRTFGAQLTWRFGDSAQN